MQLVDVWITHYRSIEDSAVIPVEPDVTCLVGKNESGKTAVLQALRRLNPVEKAVVFVVTEDYPRRHLQTYGERHAKAPVVVKARFALTPQEVSEIEAAFGPGICPATYPAERPTVPMVEVSRDYDNKRNVNLAVNEVVFVRHLVAGIADLDPRAQEIAAKASTLKELQAGLGELPDQSVSVQALVAKLAQHAEGSVSDQVWVACLDKHFPRFMYFNDYSIMHGSASLDYLVTPQAKADERLLPLLDLLRLARTSPQQLKEQANYEEHKARLEGTANFITDEVFRYWKQNRELEVEFDVAPGTTEDPAHAQGAHVLRVRIKNRRHRVTVPFDERSRGFVWFFSFLARFNAIATEGKPLILLLDEPGLSLHASAQEDFLCFIDERLAPHHQVIYTTHSPFMIQPNRLTRVRTVEDIDSKGTVVSKDALATDAATAFPLQAALGYTLAQSLFIGPNCLLVEGPSDLLYLQTMSEVVRRAGGQPLDSKWVITPVGGSGRLGMFVTLLGANKLNVAVLMDFKKQDQQLLDQLLDGRWLDKSRILRVSDFTGAKEADIEDLFDVDTYLALVNSAWPQAGLMPADLSQHPRITVRVEGALEARGLTDFDHFRPALEGMKVLATLQLPGNVVANFQQVFTRLNGLLPK